ncbi:MAG TPA: ATP-dependent DNA ligase [Candidatus Saccharimonadales bacterium]|nr:ATP-dependent DNA ligase [Candidatus Saccharimonadales bacterium]
MRYWYSAMLRFAQLCESIAATTKKTEKVRLVAAYLQVTPVEEASLAALYLCGRVFPRREERVLSIGFSILLRAVAKIAKRNPAELAPILRHHGDLGAGAEEILQDHAVTSSLTLPLVAEVYASLAQQRGPAAKQVLLEHTLQRLSALEAKYFIKIATSELRIGLKESLVEEGIAKAFNQSLPDVQRANMLLGDITDVVRLAVANQLSSVSLQLFRPISVMLASPAEAPADLVAAFPKGALVEDKFDGIRAQVHKRGSQVEIYSRTLDRVTEFPELLDPIRNISGDFILDGEIIGWRDGRAIPFTELQQRLGRKQIDLFTTAQVPVSFVAFDLLLLDGRTLLDVPLAERRLLMERLLARAEQSALQFTRAELCRTVDEIENRFRLALETGNEGLLAKAPESPYVPGRRGQFWMKLKRPLATLDVVVTVAEFGHGKRRGLLSDYTFAVRDDGRLVNIGKAYSGLTDVEIRELTKYFLEHTTEDRGFQRDVEPTVVLEVAFNNVQRSNRHDSGFALRFPRIVRLRPDKPVAEIDTLARLREIFDSQHAKKS